MKTGEIVTNTKSIVLHNLWFQYCELFDLVPADDWGLGKPQNEMTSPDKSSTVLSLRPILNANFVQSCGHPGDLYAL